MGLFCPLCDDKAMFNYPRSIFPMYCEIHKRSSMVRIKPVVRKRGTAEAKMTCLICDLDFDTSMICERCVPIQNKAEKLVLKYVTKNLDKNLSLQTNDQYTVITSNFKGSVRHKLLDLEQTFGSTKIMLVNFNVDMNNLNDLEFSLSRSLCCLEECLLSEITKSKFINV